MLSGLCEVPVSDSCTHCGQSHSSDVRFCSNCGNPITAESPATATTLPTERAGSRKGARVPLLLVRLAVVVVVVVVLIVFFAKSRTSGTPEPVRGTDEAPAMVKAEDPASFSSNTVPFVGCKSDGQGGPVAAPRGNSKVVQVSDADARRLAYYESEQGFGVLAPRGWNCLGTYGSDGTALYVSPSRVTATALFSTGGSDFEGPVVKLSRKSGDTSGRFGVAKTIARVFPARRAFVMSVIGEGVEPESSFPFGPYPDDKLTYKGAETVEYRTPADTVGLGTSLGLSRSAIPIEGVAILVGTDTDLLSVSARLPPEQAYLASAIIRQVEHDASEGVPGSSLSTASESNAVTPSPVQAQPNAAKGFPVSEAVFVNAYVLANQGRDDLDDDQLAQLARDEYKMGRDIDTQTLLLGGEILDTRGERAMNYLDKLYRQDHQPK